MSTGRTSDLSLDQLSEAQRLALEQFTSVTAQDSAEAIPILQRSQWNVEIAITKFFDGETADPFAEALQAQEGARAVVAAAAAAPGITHQGPSGAGHATRRELIGLSPAPQIIPQRDAAARRPPLLISIFLFPFSLVWRLANGTVSIFYLLFPFLRRLRGTGMAQTTKRSMNPRDTAARFARAFEEEHGASTGLLWFEGGYAQALDLAKKELRFLLVVLQSDEHDDTTAFNKTTLTDPGVIAFLKTHDIILWGGSVQESEAYQLSTALSCTKFPFAALITHAPSTPPGVSSQGMSVVARVVGATPPTVFIQKLLNAINTHTPALDRIRLQRAEQAADRAIRDQQNSAYEESLARDRERARERREAEEKRKRQEEKAALLAAEAEMQRRKRDQWRRWRGSVLPKEPVNGSLARVSIRTADGQRIIRKFEKQTRMEEVYAFVECSEIETKVEEESEGAFEKPDDYEHMYNFRLVNIMPRKVFDPEDGMVGDHLWPSGNLVVETLEEEDEEDGDEL